MAAHPCAPHRRVDSAAGGLVSSPEPRGGRMPGVAEHLERGDTDELAKFGYKQELDRSLGSFSSFAAGFSYISILTGVFQLFGFAFLSAGPAFWWSWPIVFIGQFCVAMCFAELAGQYPLAGSVYQWSKQTARAATSWMAGWLLLVGSIVTVAAVAVAYQIILPQVSGSFQIVGKASDAGLTNTPGGAQNAVILALGLVVFTTVVNMIGVKLMARINNVGVAAELVGVTLLIILLAVQTNNPRKHAPPAILRALAAAGLAGGLLMLVAMMAVGNISAKEIGTLGLPFIVKDTLGNTLGDIFLIDSAVAITVCCLAVHTAGIRMMFSMARDNRLPLGSSIARVHGKSKTPLIPALVIGGVGIVLLVINIGNQRAFFVLVPVGIILFYLAYLCVTGPLMLARLRGDWPRPDHGPFFSLGRWGMAVNVLAVVYQVIAIVNLAWPREAVYGGDHWYFQWGGVTFSAFFLIVGGLYYVLVQRDKAPEPLPEHRAELEAALAGTT